MRVSFLSYTVLCFITKRRQTMKTKRLGRNWFSLPSSSRDGNSGQCNVLLMRSLWFGRSDRVFTGFTSLWNWIWEANVKNVFLQEYKSHFFARWRMNFMHDTLENGKSVRSLNIIDDFNTEILNITIDTNLSSARVV